MVGRTRSIKAHPESLSEALFSPVYVAESESRTSMPTVAEMFLYDHYRDRLSGIQIKRIEDIYLSNPKQIIIEEEYARSRATEIEIARKALEEFEQEEKPA